MLIEEKVVKVLSYANGEEFENCIEAFLMRISGFSEEDNDVLEMLEAIQLSARNGDTVIIKQF